MVCVQAVAGKKKFLFQFKYGHNKEMSYSSLAFLYSKEEVGMDEAISHSPEKQKGELLNIVGDPEVGEPCMFVKGLFLSVFCFLCYEMDISTEISEEQRSEERDPELNEEEDTRLDAIR